MIRGSLIASPVQQLVRLRACHDSLFKAQEPPPPTPPYIVVTLPVQFPFTLRNSYLVPRDEVDGPLARFPNIFTSDSATMILERATSNWSNFKYRNTPSALFRISSEVKSAHF